MNDDSKNNGETEDQTNHEIVKKYEIFSMKYVKKNKK